ncbi:hypothetical protein FLK61_29670 [Paenalkalicoccus suaedae]|uniref:Spore coat protein n=1 Tax=Paenalkalicoccus suaedae TaxID=2592382 RepID=A0A859FCV6_9BACI|nr:TasA family protein [Paenalkalicoccus suaedae]QKS70897.1 hypothetical protein FLK61_29670 [Paenalkalicoccus suaedae]
MKKKVAVGFLTGMLGLSLVGGGTWAAFNDVEQLSGAFATGELDITVTGLNTDEEGRYVVLEDANLKPGDKLQRNMTIYNNGTLAIESVYLHFDEGEFISNLQEHPNYDELVAAGVVPSTNQEFSDEFLKQFRINFYDISPSDRPIFERIPIFQHVEGRFYSTDFTLYDLKNGDFSDFTQRMRNWYVKQVDGKNVLDLSPRSGFNANQGASFSIEIEFVDDDETIGSGGGKDRLYKQNAFQLASMNFGLSLEAVQFGGRTGTTDNELESRNRNVD